MQTSDSLRPSGGKKPAQVSLLAPKPRCGCQFFPRSKLNYQISLNQCWQTKPKFMKLQATEEALCSRAAPWGVSSPDSNEPEPRFHCFHHFNIYILRAWGNGSLRHSTLTFAIAKSCLSSNASQKMVLLISILASSLLERSQHGRSSDSSEISGNRRAYRDCSAHLIPPWHFMHE